MMNEVLITADGSHTLKSAKFDATYHSIHGAMEESTVVFIEAGLKKFLEKAPGKISILEIGFGTGLNCLLTLFHALDTNMEIHYHALEPFPIDEIVYQSLNHHELIGLDKKYLISMHEADFEKPKAISQTFFLTKYHCTLQDFQIEGGFDLVYYDAFAPNCQPELWTIETFSKVYKLMNLNSFLCTYCAKGEVKRNLKSVGFQIESLPGPARKREITRALKQ